MCSILGILGLRTDPAALRKRALELSGRMPHRGPDWSGIYSDDRAILAHERLAIVDVLHGAQPLVDPSGDLHLAVNGEIYNHRELRESQSSYAFQTDSDCEVILALYRDGISKGDGLEGDNPDWADPAVFLEGLNGIFAFVLYDQKRGRFLVARDPIGVMPLYMGWDEDGNFYVASEMKALVDVCKRIEDFPPGHYLEGSVLGEDVGEPVRYYRPGWQEYESVTGQALDLVALRTALEEAVERQLMSDVPYGVLLSGGLDSSVIAALAVRHKRRRIESGGSTEAWWPQLHTFAIGLKESPDLVAARTVAKALETVHHEFLYTLQEGHDALRDVIYHLETYDVTTIRASTPMSLLARRIKSM